MDTGTIPTCADKFIKAINDRDSKALSCLFPPGAFLVDESITFTDRAAIQTWADNGLIEHGARAVKVLDFQGDGRTTADIKILMDGDFAEAYGITEAFPLWLHFALDGDEPAAAQIKHLRIDTLDPGTWCHRAVWAAKGLPDAPLEAVRCDMRPVPVPPTGWVRVRMKASSINYHDIFTLRGWVMPGTTFPRVLGNEGVGVLEDGSEVIIYPVMSDTKDGGPDYNITLDPERHIFGEQVQGLMSEYAIVPEANLVPKPAQLPMNTAAVLGVAWLTAYRLLFTLSGLKPGQRMLVQGSAGGIATGLIRMGIAAGMEVWVTGRSTEKQQLARDMGAHHVMGPDAALPVKVHAVFNLSGAATWKHSMASVAHGGTVLVCAVHGGATLETDVSDLFLRGITVRGSYMGTMDEFRGLVDFVTRHNIEPLIDAVVPLEGVREGIEKMAAGRVRGKIVVRI
ncbi:hypothetical protein B0H63DRAFT_6363 [Podospora didyma]|uniref:Enoyl reductase (ER) domain-containing protein n=1 Tax=Podospora didyma TaxID=330526 RepID=A0AAE0P451_9PEZI|nr:hypothetical protein B0H63DRAFT_6363 [Podospora didyma]